MGFPLIRKICSPYYPDQESLCQETLSGTAAKGRDDRGKSISYKIRDEKRESSIQRTVRSRRWMKINGISC